MKNKGNQKHLTFEQRVDIEKGLTENKSFTEIGRIIGKNPSTISKEVRLHAHTKERPDSGYTHPPCIHRKNCKVTCLCDKMCGIHCKLCRKPSFRCTDICPAYETDRSYRQGHNYEDFQNYLKDHPDTNVVEMDCVEGKKGESRALLTFTFRNCNLMLMFLLEYQDQECVLEVFVWLETVLGQDAFKKLFPVILTDGGSEFSAREEMEEFCDGSKSTTVFYCDPYSFWQKGACEKNHEYIRYIRPKGSSFADLNDEKIRLMMNHINNEKRDSLNGHSPYELSLLLLDNKLHKALGLKAIAPDDVMLSPKLIK